MQEFISDINITSTSTFLASSLCIQHVFMTYTCGLKIYILNKPYRKWHFDYFFHASSLKSIYTWIARVWAQKNRIYTWKILVSTPFATESGWEPVVIFIWFTDGCELEQPGQSAFKCADNTNIGETLCFNGRRTYHKPAHLNFESLNGPVRIFLAYVFCFAWVTTTMSTALVQVHTNVRKLKIVLLIRAMNR